MSYEEEDTCPCMCPCMCPRQYCLPGGGGGGGGGGLQHMVRVQGLGFMRV